MMSDLDRSDLARFWSSLMTLEHTIWKLEAGNNADPDDGKSMVCHACLVPIFSTPFVSTSTSTSTDGDDHHVHDQCADHHLPLRLKDHPLHPTFNLYLHGRGRRSCSRCNSMCGSRYYACPECDFVLDLVCALRIRIQHRSHGHRLEAVRGISSSFICAACGTRHNNNNNSAGHKKGYNPEGLTTWDLSYVCFTCDFWIHPDCARLPNAIRIDGKHQQHPLLLTYLGQDPSRGFIWQNMPTHISCSICDGGESEGFGFYACFCCDYYAHIKCVIYSDPGHCSFKPVLLRDAQVPNLIRLPLTNEHTSVVSRIFLTDETRDHGGAGSALLLLEDDDDRSVHHEHPLILHQHQRDDDDDEASSRRVCSACVQPISPEDGPFYSCCDNNNNESSSCRDFFLHRCCAHLPATLTFARSKKRHTHTLVDTTKEPFNLFRCFECLRRCNGFAYQRKLKINNSTGSLDVVCALMSSALITHDAHAKSHFLQPLLSKYQDKTCCCCREPIVKHFNSGSGYGCTNCHNFYIHANCALLPNTVNHKFDRHPLNLITTTTSTTLDHQQEEEESAFCEICEKHLDTKLWYYYCDKCDHSFHAACIPCLDHLSKIRFGFSVRVEGHDCPLTCVRALTVAGYSCSHCGQTIDDHESHGIAFECSQCYFRIHEKCAQEILLQKS